MKVKVAKQKNYNTTEVTYHMLMLLDAACKEGYFNMDNFKRSEWLQDWLHKNFFEFD